ncbi:MAG: multiheme c-type cytochrome [Gemmatimonadota bacterium]
MLLPQLVRRFGVHWGGLVAMAFAGACGRAEPASRAAGGPAQRAPAAARSQGPSLEAAATAAHVGPTALGVPVYPDAREALELERFMWRAWQAAGEPEDLFTIRLGERIFETEARFERVREFYLPFIHKVFMDHEMEFPEVGSQKMLTGLMVAPDGALVKFTVTHPFFRYPDRKPVDRTVIQMGPGGGGPLRGRSCVLAATVVLSGACGGANGDGAEEALPADESSEVEAFLEAHWQRPIPPQGPPPEGWLPIATDLDPSACGACHIAQYRDWSSTFHAGAYSPGLEDQLVAWFENDPATVTSCMACHGPLTEQLRRVAPDSGEWVENPVHDPGLERQGVVCAACHVRDWRRYGPPRRDGSVAPAPPGTPHEGAIRRTEFESSRFCAVCHQFEEPAPNGKPLENTVREWEAREFARRGVTCQSCHMPDRSHLWRGIHDPGMTRSGVTPEWRVEGRPENASFHVWLALTNTGTGHHFPTYVTPAVDLEIAFLDTAGDTLATRIRTLQRDAYFDGAQWVEREDDRIPAGETRALEWSGPVPRGSARVTGRVVVRPDAFYRDFFADLLAGTPEGAAARPLLEEALARTKASPYELWSWEEPLTSTAGRS